MYYTILKKTMRNLYYITLIITLCLGISACSSQKELAKSSQENTYRICRTSLIKEAYQREDIVFLRKIVSFQKL